MAGLLHTWGAECTWKRTDPRVYTGDFALRVGRSYNLGTVLVLKAKNGGTVQGQRSRTLSWEKLDGR